MTEPPLTPVATIGTFEPAAGVASAQGLDVSNFQGQYDWAAAVQAMPGLAFGIHRLTQGLGAPGTNSPDPTARHNHQQIRDNGLRRGAYHFLDPRQSGPAQARYFIDTHGHLGITEKDMLWCDNETHGSSPGAVAGCAAEFMAELRTLRPNNPMGVYTYISFAREGNCDGLGKWPLWLAFPNLTAPQPPPPWMNWKFWQWGLRKGVDADAFNGTIGDLDAWLASFTPDPGSVKHLTQPGDTLGALADARNMDVWAWLALQRRLSGPQAAHLVRRAECEPGSTWRSVNP